MGFTMPLLLLLLLVLAVVWIVLLWKGVDPARLLRSSFKSPQHFLTPASYAERAKLLAAVHAQHTGPRTGQTLLYSDAISQLGLCNSVAEMEEILQFVVATRLINSDIKAQHFAQHCQRKLPLKELSLTTLSMVITALHRYVKFRVVANCVQHCIEATSGADCFALKNALERTVSLYRLVCQRIAFTDVREAIMVHLEREAATLTASPAFVRPIKLLCDIDDTMISVLFDTRYPDLTVYPGVHQFVEELLHCGPNASGAEATQSGSDPDGAKELRSRITFLTARPEIMRRRSVRQLRASGFFHFNLLMGKLSHVVLGPRRIALGKLENFESFRRLFAEHQFIFVGDNGQGDIDLGKDMLAQPEKYGVSVVLIHDIIRNHVRSATALAKAGVEIEAYRRQECERHGIHLFTTYIGAIATLYEQGLVDAAAVARVAQKTLAAHAAIVHETESQRELVEREVAWDVARVLDTMPEVRLESIVAELPTELQRLIEIKRMGRATDDATLNV